MLAHMRARSHTRTVSHSRSLSRALSCCFVRASRALAFTRAAAGLGRRRLAWVRGGEAHRAEAAERVRGRSKLMRHKVVEGNLAASGWAVDC